MSHIARILRGLLCFLIVMSAPWAFAYADSRRDDDREDKEPSPVSVELVLFNGKIFTADPARPWAEALAIRGARIVAIGTNASIERFASRAARVIDLDGRLVIPGINDAHMHEPFLVPGRRVDLFGARTVAEAADRIRDAAEQGPGWILGVFGPMFDDPSATREALDQIVSSNPVILDVTQHGALLNSLALQEWSIDDRAADPPSGWYGRDADGRVNGWLYEYAYWDKGRQAARSRGEEEILAAFEGVAQMAARFGITTVQYMGLLSADESARLLEKTSPTIRWRVIDFVTAESVGADSAGPEWGAEARIRRSGTKYILDGSPVERGAALEESYSDRPGHFGRMNFLQTQIASMLEASIRNNDPLLLHVGGDVPPRSVIEVLRGMPRQKLEQLPRLRLEHCDLLTPDLFEEVQRLGIVVVQNPSHFMQPEVIYGRYGVQRTQRYAPVRSLLRLGIPFAIGSDGPMHPFLNIMFAAIHATNPAEGMTVEEAVVAYTAGSAYAELAERRKGRLARGMLADLAVLSQDIFAVPLHQLPATESILTVVGGRIVYERN